MTATLADTDLFDQAEAARRLGQSVRWLKDHRHEIPYVRVGRSRRYSQAHLELYIARHTVDPDAPSKRGRR